MLRSVQIAILSGVLMFFLNSLMAQKNDTTSVPDTLEKKEEVPDALKNFVKEYQEEIKKDSAIAKEEDLLQKSLLSGLVMDNTLSKMGYEFYRYFNDKWNPPEMKKSFTVYIYEKPAPGIGNIVTVKINYEQIFKGKLAPRPGAVKKTAQRALKQSKNYVENYKRVSKQLEGKDMKGTGIY
jgi:curli production assembly/transport component CsgE